MRINRRHALSFLASAPAAAIADPTRPVTVFEAGRIVTMEPAIPYCRFVAVQDGIILGLANSLEELAVWTRGRKVEHNREFARHILLPGLIDPHVHPMQSSVMLNLPFLAPDDWELPSGSYPGARTQAAYRERLSAMLRASGERPFITWGYHDLFHGPIDRAYLDTVAPDLPVVIWHRSFHDVIVNTAMLREWGLDSAEAFDAAIAKAKADPLHGSLERGLFSETALPIALDRMRSVILAPERISKGMGALQRMMRDNGVTTISDMATGAFASFDAEAAMIAAAFERPGSAARVMLMPMALALPAETDPETWFLQASKRFSSRRLRVDRRVKMLADGAFFAQNMQMKAPGYSDGHSGKWITEPDALLDQFRRFWDAGFSLHVHVNGDAGLEVVLDGVAGLPIRRRQTVTLEHLGYSNEDQNRRIAQLGCMVSAQPNYIRVLGDAYARVGLGADRASAINRLGSLERKGVPLGLHSDFNMAPINPLYLAWIAANRVTLEGSRPAPAERLSLDKALRAITIEAAQVIGMDHMVGSIAAGKKADFAVLSADPYAAGAARLREIAVEGVIFEGQVAGRSG